ncbi:MAG: biopolymer transporter ExbD [Candidatus Hydrogenedentes bacterium]|nr:biopolymer transporter ExbD [Candidatus Hydrogenedentota bacterium]
MNSAFRGRTRRRPTINITSLIDVMFLLLIFFMVSSTCREDLGSDVTLPHAETAVEQTMEPQEITVTEKGDFFFGQQLVDEAGLEKSIQELLRENPDAVFVLRADENADFGRVVRAIDIARDAGGAKLIIPTRYKEPRVNEQSYGEKESHGGQAP